MEYGVVDGVWLCVRLVRRKRRGQLLLQMAFLGLEVWMSEY